MSTHHTAMRLYGMALKLYPAPFRSEFGEEMSEVFGRAVTELFMEEAGGGDHRSTFPP